MHTPIMPFVGSSDKTFEMFLNILEACFANDKNTSSAEVRFEL